MTKKRYIKLLMGKLELSRNEARDRAARFVSLKNKFDASDKTLKALGKKTRIGTISYAEAGTMTCSHILGLKKER